MSASSCFGSIFELANARRSMGATCRAAILLGAATHLVGCVDEDRVLATRCRVATDGFAAVTFSPSDDSEATIGGFNAREDALGVLFQLEPDRKHMTGARWTPVHTLVTPAVSVVHEVYWNSLSVNAHLETALDGEALPESTRVNVEFTLLSGSGLTAWDVQREAIEDVLHVVNGDPKAVSILEGASAQDQYLVISSRLLAKEVGLYYTPGGGIWLSDGRGSVSTPFITPWTFRMGRTNFHSYYSCKPVDELNSKAASMNARVPAVYFYTAVRYDSAKKGVVRDLRVSELDLLTASRGQQTER